MARQRRFTSGWPWAVGVADAVLARLRRYGGISGPVTTGTKAGGNPNVIVTIDAAAAV